MKSVQIEALTLSCRMCRVGVGRRCVPYGTMDRDAEYRAENPHRLRIVDAIAVLRRERRRAS